MGRENKGLTLIELLVALAVAAILITVGAPELRSMLERNRAQDAVSRWQGDLSYARQAAAAYQTSITVCPLNSASSCSGDWSQGYTIFIDANSNGALEALDERLHQRNPIDARDAIGADSPQRFRFTEDGLSEEAGTLVYCAGSAADDAIKAVSVSSTGQARQIETSLTCD